MNHRPGPRNADTIAQDRAFNHPDVVAVATNVVQGNHISLVRLANIAIVYPWPGVLATQPGIPSEVQAYARGIADAGLRIAAEADEETRDRRRGALVERVVWELVKKRDRRARRERCIELTRNRWSGESWSKPKEIVCIRTDECEVYECKLSPRGLNNDDTKELADIRDTAAADDLTPYVGVATLETGTTFRQHATRLRTHGPLYYVTQAEILGLGSSTPEKTFSH